MTVQVIGSQGDASAEIARATVAELRWRGHDVTLIQRSHRAGFKAGAAYTIRTRTGNYPNMILAAVPHEERPEDWESIPMFLTFQELQTAGATYSPLAPRRRSDGDTVQKGQQDKTSVLKSAVNTITNTVKGWGH